MGSAAKAAALLAAALLILVLLASYRPAPRPAGGLLADVEESRLVMWVGAHPDDEVYVAGLLAYASRVLGKHCVIVSFMYSPAKRAMNKASASYLGCEYVYLEEVEGRSWEEKFRAVLDRYKPDIVVTFDPGNGFRGLKAHMAAARVVEDVVESGYSGVKLYYVVNKDPVLAELLNGPLDPSPATDVLDLDASYPGLGSTLWEAKLHVISIYSRAVPACRAIASNAGGIQDRMAHKEFYSATRG